MSWASSMRSAMLSLSMFARGIHGFVLFYKSFSLTIKNLGDVDNKMKHALRYVSRVLETTQHLNT
jgi:predicted transcriptional regulator